MDDDQINKLARQIAIEHENRKFIDMLIGIPIGLLAIAILYLLFWMMWTVM